VDRERRGEHRTMLGLGVDIVTSDRPDLARRLQRGDA
jgi:predicted nucleotidyltransferase